MDRFSHACHDFGLTISLKKTNVLGQDVDTPPVIIIVNYQLEVVHEFTYLGSSDWLNRVGGWVVGYGSWVVGCRSWVVFV